MEDLSISRYLKLAALTLGLAVLIYLFLLMFFTVLGINDFPQSVRIMVSVLASGLLVFKFFSGHIF